MGEKVEEEKKAAEGGEEKVVEKGEEKVAPVKEVEEKSEGEEEDAAEAEAEEEEEKKGKEEGEKKGKEEEEKKAEAEVAEKTEDSLIVVVLKLDLHCEGCARKVRRAVSNFEGVKSAKADAAENELIVTGLVDPELIRKKVKNKTGKPVVLISPLGGGEKKTDEKKTEEKEKPTEKPKQEPVITTVVFNIKLHCQGCARKIKRTIRKNFDGVEAVETDLDNNSVTVTGTIDANGVASFLEEKLKRSVEIVPPPKKDDGGGDNKVEDKKGGGDHEGDGGEDGDGEEEEDEEPKMEINKMAYSSNNPFTYYAAPYTGSHYTTILAMQYPPPAPAGTYVHHDPGYYIHDQYPAQGYPPNYGYPHHGYVNRGYPVHGPSMPGMSYRGNANDGFFSDENPNGCFII